MRSKQLNLNAGQAVTVEILGVKESCPASVASIDGNAVVACIGSAIPVNTPVSLKSDSLLLLGEVCAMRQHAGEFQILVLVEQYMTLTAHEREAPRTSSTQETPVANADRGNTRDSLYALVRHLIGDASRRPALTKVAKA